MVVSKEKDAKRKRKESPTIESPELPKRTKVQAQRKFAQGQHAPSSSSYSFTGSAVNATASTSGNSLPGNSSVRENREPPPELITKRPKPEDFLTFLCFRGTPVLPTKLDFLNQNKNVTKNRETNTESTKNEIAKKNATQKTRATTSKLQKNLSIPTETSTTISSKCRETSSVTVDVSPGKNLETKDNNIKSPKKNEIIPFAVRKRAEQTTEGNKNSKNNKNKTKALNHLSAKDKEDSARRSLRTRGKTTLELNYVGDDGSEIIDEHQETNEIEPVVDNKIKSNIDEYDFENETKEKPSTIKGKRKSGGKLINQDEEIFENKNTETVVIEEVKENDTIEQTSAKKFPLKRGPKPKPIKIEKVKSPEPEPEPEREPEPEPVGRMTRQRAFFEPVKVPPKPEMLVEKKNCDDDIKELEKVIESKTNNDQVEFSSEDEQPLAKTIKLTNDVKKSPKKLTPTKSGSKKGIPTNDASSKKSKTPSVIDNDQSSALLIEFSPAPSQKNEGKKIPKKKSLVKDVIANKDPSETKLLTNLLPQSKVTNNQRNNLAIGKASITLKQKENEESIIKKSLINSKLSTKMNKKNLSKNVHKDKLESEDDSFGKLTTTTTIKNKGRKKRGADADISQQSQTDVSENDVRTGRPTRKTKEAATIYMELIGQKLNLGDFDEDDFSMDSFPELPNVKETQKMETELKKNVGRSKNVTTSATASLPTAKFQNEIYPLVTGDMSDDLSINKSPLQQPIVGKKRGRKKKLVENADTFPVKKTSPLEKKKKLNKKIGSHQENNLNEEDKPQLDSQRKLEKSFSDSDDEPLAIKLTKTSERDFNLAKKSESNNFRIQSPVMNSVSGIASSSIAQVLSPTTKQDIENKVPLSPQAASTPHQIDKNKLQSDDRQLKLITPPRFVSTTKPQIKTPQNTIIPSGQLAQIHHTPKHHQNQSTSSATGFTPLETYPSPKINPTFLTPKFDRNLERRMPATNSTIDSQLIAQKNLSFPSSSVQASMTTQVATAKLQESTTNTPKSTSPSNNSSANAIANILATNLMPSKEESGKIFGIASVSLAQSSGPDNTKCTLGKCGSVHKPVLGPVVPTESYLGEQQLSSKERRKAKVNMTHEQIQKWLIECSSNPDVIQDDLDDDFDDILKPSTFAPTPPPAPIKDDKESTSTSSKTTTKQDLGKTESAWSGKGPSLKATPVIAKEDVNKFEESTLQEMIIKKEEPLLAASAPTPPPQTPTTVIPSVISPETKKLQQNLTKKEKKKIEQEIKLKEKKEIAAAKKIQQQPTVAAVSSTKSKQSPIKESPKGKNIKSSQSAITPNLTKSQKKQQNKNKSEESTQASTQSINKTPKRQPVYSSKTVAGIIVQPTETKRSIKSKIGNSFAAFSPDNEKSVYSFDKEDEDILPSPLLLAKPFRRQSRRDSHNDDQSLNDSKALTMQKQDKKLDNCQQNSISLTLSPDDNRKLAKMNLDSITPEKNQKKYGKQSVYNSDAKSTTNEFVLNDSEGETFYIPLQGAAVGGTSGDKSDLLQAVEVKVKVGREGPAGPNQRVCVQATLVTKSQINTTNNSSTGAIVNAPTASTIIDTIDNNKNKEIAQNNNGTVAAATSAKSVPVGTVTPRFKSSSVVEQQQQQIPTNSATLTRVNSNSSLFSGSGKSRAGGTGGGGGGGNSTTNSKKHKDDTAIKMCNNTAFPRHDDPSQMVEAPVFRPTEKEFHDPMEFIERITPIAARFGICKIIPPASFKPECRVSDDMRFSAYNQYVHKMLHRWGPSVKEFHAIKKHCGTQSVSLTPFPLIGQMEVDLPRLYHTVQELGGLQEVMEKKKWTRVADEMCIPKLAQDRASRLDDIYCKYLLPYDTLSPTERQKLFDEVEADWAKREARARRNADHCLNSDSDSNDEDEDEIESSEDSDDEDTDGAVSMECIVKGKSMPLKQFFRIARNTMSLWFKNTEPNVAEVEAEFWRHVAVRDSHVCVHSGSIDSSGWGYGFPSPGPKGKGSPCAKHPWNLKVLTNNPGSVLRSLGPVMGVTVPTLHVGMLFSACCWYRDPHGLSWIEYLHTGASKIWYGIPDEQSSNFRSALTAFIPTHCQNKTIWLPCDTAMVPPHMLTDRGVSLCRIEQKPGEFVVIFPRAYTSSLSSGYVVSESVYFATASWLDLAKEDFKDIHDSCEPAMFSLEQLLFAIASDQRVTVDILAQCLPMIHEVFEKEQAAREQLKATGVKSIEKLTNDKSNKTKKKPVIPQFTEEDNECVLCRANLYISMVKTNDGNNIYCLQHALKNLNKGNILADQCKLIFTYSIEDIEELIKKLKERLAHKNKSTFAFSSNSGGGGGGGGGTSKKK